MISKSAKSAKPPTAAETSIGDSDSDAPINQKLASEKSKIQQQAEKDAKSSRKQSNGTAPKKGRETNASKNANSAKGKPATNGKKAQSNGIKKSESSDEDVPLSRKVPATSTARARKQTKSESSTPVKTARGKVKKEATQTPDLDDEGDAEEEEYRWWENPQQGDGTIKWTTLEHNGVVFPPPYEPLPKNVKMKYNGVPITLQPEAEEVAGFFGGMLNSTHNVENPTFQKNFFQDFTDVIKKTGGAKGPDGKSVPIKEFAKCDFQPIFDFYQKQKEEKKALPAAEKKKLKAEKDAAEAPYMFCMWDGRKQKVGNFRVEPPALFRGRGEHPKTGKVKTRVMPEQITINIGKEAKVPVPPEGHQWKEVKHDQEGTWLAMWQENINGNYKYVMLAANSDIKGQSDYKKFEKARELKVSFPVHAWATTRNANIPSSITSIISGRITERA